MLYPVLCEAVVTVPRLSEVGVNCTALVAATLEPEIGKVAGPAVLDTTTLPAAEVLTVVGVKLISTPQVRNDPRT